MYLRLFLGSVAVEPTSGRAETPPPPPSTMCTLYIDKKAGRRRFVGCPPSYRGLHAIEIIASQAVFESQNDICATMIGLVPSLAIDATTLGNHPNNNIPREQNRYTFLFEEARSPNLRARILATVHPSMASTPSICTLSIQSNTVETLFPAVGTYTVGTYVPTEYTRRRFFCECGAEGITLLGLFQVDSPCIACASNRAVSGE